MTEKEEVEMEIFAAQMFCIGAHCAKGQKRKYSGEDYHVHPLAVARILIKYGYTNREMLQAALLHDVIEDTDVTKEHVAEFFGENVANMVDDLTKKPVLDSLGLKSLSRADQKLVDAARLQATSPTVKTIKLADKLDNLPSIIAEDPKFAKVYIEEARHLLFNSLVGGDARMWLAVKEIIDNYDDKA